MDSYVLRALCFQGLGDVDRAQQTLAAMEEFASQTRDTSLFPIANSCAARVALLQGDPARAGAAIRYAHLSDDSQAMLFWTEVPRITACRTQVASGTSVDAEAVLDRLRRYAGENRRVHNRLRLLELLVLQTAAYLRAGEEEGALVALREAVEIAQLGGVVQPFIEAGSPIVPLLRRLGRESADPEFVRRLLAVCDGQTTATAPELSPDGPVAASPALRTKLLGRLTVREQEVLELLTQRLQAKEIADRLFIATSTVNFHIKNIYTKLQAHGRRDAIAKLRQLDAKRGPAGP